MSLTKLEYTVSFNTPAFLGNAEQQAQWRTPPFKALIRQWWRVVKATELLNSGIDPQVLHVQLRNAEGILFGSVSDDNETGSSKSSLRLRLSSWHPGLLGQWLPNEPKVSHPEVKFPVGADLYLGYGPLGYDKPSKSTQFSQIRDSNLKRTAIAEKESARLILMFPIAFQHEIEWSLKLASLFGTLGSRSRSGWGALHLEGDKLFDLEKFNAVDLQRFTRGLRDCLQLEWPHAVGLDQKGPLVWKTPPMNAWRDVMRELARIKIAFRTQFKFTAPGFNARHILAYPVTHHSVPGWGNQSRLGNQVRFKVAKAGEKYFGVIVHLPCRLPGELERLLKTRPDQLGIWRAVHAVLDQNATRIQ